MNLDGKRRLILSKIGTLRDLREQGLHLEEGLVLHVYSDDLDAEGRAANLSTTGIVRYDGENARCVLEIDWNAVTHESSG
jgi:hypothetical protein